MLLAIVFASSALYALSSGAVGARSSAGPEIHAAPTSLGLGTTSVTGSVPHAVAPPGESPSVVSTLVLANNSQQGGNFLAANGLAPWGVTYDNRTAEMFVTATTGGVLLIMSVSTNTVIGTVAGFSDPLSDVYDSGKGEVFVANENAKNVIIVSDVSDSIVGKVPVGTRPWGITYDSGKSEIFVTNEGSKNVSVISDVTDKVVANIPVGTDPEGATYDPTLGEVFVSNANSANVSIISDATNTVVGSVSVITTPTGIVYDGGRADVYVSNSGSILSSSANSVSVIGAANRTNFATVPVGSTPGGITYDSGRSEIFVVNSASNNVSVIADTSNKVVANIPIGYGGTRDAYATNGGGEIYVTNENSDNISVINDATNKVSASPLVGANPYAISYDSGTAQVFVSNYNLDSEANYVFAFSTVTGNVIATVPTIPQPVSLAYDYGTAEIYVGGTGFATGAGNATVISDASDTAVDTIQLDTGSGGAQSAAYDNATNQIYFGHASTNLSQISDVTNKVTANITVGQSAALTGLAYDSGKHELFASNQNNNTVEVISPTTQRLVAQIPVGRYPSGIAYVPALGELFVANFISGNVSVISDTTNTVVATIPVGTSPWGVAYDSLTSSIFVVNEGSNNVSEITTATNQVIANFAVGSEPENIAYDAASNLLYVTNDEQGTISVISAGTSPTTIASLVANPSSINLGETTNLSVSAYGGTGIYAYSFTGLPPGCTSSDLDFLPCTPTAIGSFTVRAFVNDTSGSGSGTRANSTTTLIVSRDSIVSFAAAPSSLDVGHPSVLTVRVTGSVRSFSFAYFGLPPGCTTSSLATLACTPRQTGTFGVTVYANLTGSSASGSSASATTSIKVNPLPSITSFTPSPMATTMGETVTFAVVAAGGTGGLSYAYTGLPSGCSSANVSNLPCVPSRAGTYSVRVYANDSMGGSANASVALTVNSGPAVRSFGASNPVIDLGGSTEFSTSATGGTSPLGFAYSGLPSGCTSSNAQSLECTPTATGTFTVKVYVNDSVGASTSATAQLVVNTNVSVTSFSASTPSISLGGFTDFEVSARGGTGSLAYVYTGLPSGCATLNQNFLACTPTATGSYTVRVFANDTVGGGATATADLTVLPALVSITIAPSTVTLAPSSEANLTTSYLCSGGSCPAGITYAWHLSQNIGTLNSTTSAEVTLVAGAVAGSATLSVTGTLNGVVVRSEGIPIVISPPTEPVLVAVTLNIGSAIVATHGTQSISATPVCSNGACPSSGISYAWTLSTPLGTLNSASTASVIFTAGGQAGKVYLNVTVSLSGNREGSSATISITSSSSGSSSSASFSAVQTYELAAGVGVAVVIVCLVVFLSRKRGPTADTNPKE